MNKKLLLLTLSAFLLSPIWVTAMEEDGTTQNDDKKIEKDRGPLSPDEKYRPISEERKVEIIREVYITRLVKKGMSEEEAEELVDNFY